MKDRNLDNFLPPIPPPDEGDTNPHPALGAPRTGMEATQGVPASQGAPSAGSPAPRKEQPANVDRPVGATSASRPSGPAPGARPTANQNPPAGAAPPGRKTPPALVQFIRRRWLWLLLGMLAFASVLVVGAASGYLSAQETLRRQYADQAVLDLGEQYNLALGDLQDGRYQVAQQRFEFILKQDASYPGAAEGLTQAIQVLYATATPSAIPASPTPTPTRDLRPAQDLLAEARSQAAGGEWAAVIETLNNLRREDTAYQVAQVDGLLYIALRQRGVQKIQAEANLGGGIYDLTLAEGFGPLDGEALSLRLYARLYLIGSSFWEVLPEQAVYYFGQVAAGAPYLRDASGWTAAARYQASIVQYGDWFAKAGDWCAAQVQYELGLSMGGDETTRQKAEEAALQCAPPTETPEATGTETLTPTPTETPTPTNPFEPTATSTQPGEITPTPSPTNPGTTPPGDVPTQTPTPTQQEPPTQEPTTPPAEIPTETPTPPPPPPSETPSPTTPSDQSGPLESAVPTAQVEP